MLVRVTLGRQAKERLGWVDRPNLGASSWRFAVESDSYAAARAAYAPRHEWSNAYGYRLAGSRWEIYGDPDPSTGDFEVAVFWSLATP